VGVSTGLPGGPAAPRAPETVRVTVAAAGRRVDLVLPADLPVVELVPGLARIVGLLDPRTAYAGFRLSTPDGHPLRGEAGLTEQGVREGQVLLLLAAADDPDPPRYDDVAEAMADAVGGAVGGAVGAATEPGAWPPAGWSVVCACCSVGLVGAVLAGPDRSVSALLGGCAVVLVAVATVLSRACGSGATSLLVAWLACAHAAGAGALLGDDARVRLLGAGAGVALTGSAACVGLGEGRLLVVPPVAVGAAFLAAGLAADRLPVAVGWMVTLLLATATVAVEALPCLALSTARGLTSAAGRHVDEPVDLARVRAWARAADRVVLAGSASVATLVVVAAPYAVSTGPAGTLASVLCDLVVLLRARGQREPGRTVGRVGGLLGVVATAVSVLWLQPSWRGAEAVALVVLGLAGLAQLLAARPDPLLVDRLCEVTRSTALVALPTTVLVASGLLPVPHR
jgi:ESX secretion system protein EccD